MSEDPAAKPAPEPERLSIEKPPPGEILARFKTKRSPDERIQTLLPALPHLKISDAKDYVRLHPDEAYWSDEYCFVMVPVPGLKDSVLHLLASDLADTRPPGSLQYFRLALATKPHDQFFLAHVPSRNLDNWNKTPFPDPQWPKETLCNSDRSTPTSTTTARFELVRTMRSSHHG